MLDTAKKIMSKGLVTIKLGDSIRTAFQVMQEKNIRHLPVVDQAGHIIGLLSDRDVRRAMIPKSESDALAWDEGNIEFNPNHAARNFMSWPAKTISASTPIMAITQMILREKLSALVVTAEKSEQAIGIITTDDLLKLLMKLLENEPEAHNLRLEDEFFHAFRVSN